LAKGRSLRRGGPRRPPEWQNMPKGATAFCELDYVGREIYDFERTVVPLTRHAERRQPYVSRLPTDPRISSATMALTNKKGKRQQLPLRNDGVSGSSPVCGPAFWQLFANDG
jgi:hypothetical protein